MKVLVEVDKGPSQGTKYEIENRSYRAVGRVGSKDATVQLSTDGDVGLKLHFDKNAVSEQPTLCEQMQA